MALVADEEQPARAAPATHTTATKTSRFHSADVGRIGAFSDCVFSIAMTLLVLNFRTPNLDGGDIDHQLFEFVKSDYELLISYALGVFVIGRYWLAHHRLFRLVRRSDPALLELNLLMLALVALVPWPSELIGRYGNATTAVVVYAVAIGLLGLANAALWRHAWRAKLLDPEVTERYFRHSMFRGLCMPAVFVASIPIAFVDPNAAELSWIVLAFMGTFGRRRWGSIHEPFESEA